MKNRRHLLFWLRCVDIGVIIISSIWVVGKLSSLWMLFVSSRHRFTDEEWRMITRVKDLDKIMLILLAVSVLGYVYIRKKIDT